MAGAEVGLKPKDIYDMEYWEFNFYLKGYRERLYHEEVQLMKQSYNTGMLSRESKRKPKSLEYYINQIDREFHKVDYRNTPVDTQKSRKIYEEITKLKQKEMMNDGE